MNPEAAHIDSRTALYRLNEAVASALTRCGTLPVRGRLPGSAEPLWIPTYRTTRTADWFRLTLACDLQGE